MHAGKRHQIHRDLVQIDVERAVESRRAGQVKEHIGDYVVHGIEGLLTLLLLVGCTLAGDDVAARCDHFGGVHFTSI